MDDSCGMNAVGEPYEGKPHVRFDEGLVETQFGWAPPVYSTVAETVGRRCPEGVSEANMWL